MQSMEEALSELRSLKDLDSTTPLIVMDLETTGLNPAKAQITQIGAACVSPEDNFQKIVKSFEANIDLLPEVYNQLEGESIESHEQKLSELGLEHYKGQLSPHVDSAHWLLAYNNHHPLNQWEKGEDGSLVEEQMHDSSGPLFASRKNPDGTTMIGEDGKPIPDETKPRMYRVPKRLSKEQIEAIKKDATSSGMPTEEKALKEFHSWLSETPNGIVCGHNAMAFDWTFVNQRFELYGLPKIAGKKFYDTMWVSRLIFIPALETLVEIQEEFDIDGDTPEKILSILKGSKSKPSSALQSLKTALKLPGGLAHTAIGDVETTIQLFKKMHGFIKSFSAKIESDLKAKELYQAKSDSVWNESKQNGFKY